MKFNYHNKLTHVEARVQADDEFSGKKFWVCPALEGQLRGLI